MSEFQEIRNQIDRVGTLFEAFKSVHDAQISELKHGNTGRVAELGEKMNRIEKDLQTAVKAKEALERLDGLEDRLNDLETRASRPARTGLPGERGDNPTYTKHFCNWFKSGGKSTADEFAMKEIGTKDVTLASPSGGGVALPKEIARLIEQYELKISPLRSLVNLQRVGSSDFHTLLNLRGMNSGWVGETGGRVLTGTPSLRDCVPTWGEVYSYCQASEWAVDDIFFDVANWIAENAADEFAFQEGTAIISGNGTNKPTGMTNTVPVTTLDFASPLRAAAAYMYLPSIASPFSVNGNDALIDVIYSLNAAYRSGAVYGANSSTWGSIRKLKAAGTGDYLWRPGLENGTPATLNGFPAVTIEALQDIGASTFPVFFGNLRRAYILCDRFDVRISVDNNITTPGLIKWFIRRRVGGIPYNNDALRFIRTS